MRTQQNTKEYKKETNKTTEVSQNKRQKWKKIERGSRRSETAARRRKKKKEESNS